MLTKKKELYMLKKIIKTLTISTLILSFNASAVKISECMTSECVTYFKSFKKASGRGHRNAMYNLGKFYEFGFGTDINKAKALSQYKKAGINGVREAEYKAGEILLTDKELYNFDDGVNWLKRASRKGHPRAAFLLGQSYYANKDYADADVWLTTVYSAHPKRIVNWLTKAQKVDSFNQQNLPSLHAAFEQTPISTHKAIANNNIEVITVTGQHLYSALDSMLGGFRKKIRTTGTRLPNITCDQSVACAKKSLNEMKDSMWVSQK
jgi:hypothetical protein